MPRHCCLVTALRGTTRDGAPSRRRQATIFQTPERDAARARADGLREAGDRLVELERRRAELRAGIDGGGDGAGGEDGGKDVRGEEAAG